MLSDFLSEISLREPWWLIIAFQPVSLWLFLFWKKQQTEKKFADKHLLPWLRVRNEQNVSSLIFSRNTAYVISWVLFSLAMAGPRIPDHSENRQEEILMDVILVVDLSRSMSATDIKPSRLRRATLEVFDFLSIIKNARIGVVVYAARPHLYVPLTSDINALTFYLKELDSLQLPSQGSDALAALKLAKKQLLISSGKGKIRTPVILWLTDGDIEQQKQSKIETELIKSKNIDSFILTLGTEEGGAIPLPKGGWLAHEGQPVISKMDKNYLNHLNKYKNIHVSQVRSDNADWDKIYFQGMRRLLSNSTTDKNYWVELYQWLLFPAILLQLIVLLPVSFFKRLYSKLLNKTTIQIISLCLLTIFLLNTTTLSANELSYESVIKQGINAYKKSEFIKAKKYFISSVLKAKTDKERAIALHDLGNTLFQLGDYARSTELFTDALRYDKKQIKSKNNQKISLEVYIAEQNRIKKRMNLLGAFNQSNNLYDLPEQLPFMLTSKAISLLKISLPKLPEKTLNYLLGKSILDGSNKIELLDADEKMLSKKKEQHLNIEQARLFYLEQQEQSSNMLWKRLFEVEEGFSGDLKTPKIIPGVRPW